jgi:hypothetical protein
MNNEERLPVAKDKYATTPTGSIIEFWWTTADEYAEFYGLDSQIKRVGIYVGKLKFQIGHYALIKAGKNSKLVVIEDNEQMIILKKANKTTIAKAQYCIDKFNEVKHVTL